MEPIRYFESVDLIEPHCNGCQHIIHYDKDTIFDKRKQILTCGFCGTPV